MLCRAVLPSPPSPHASFFQVLVKNYSPLGSSPATTGACFPQYAVDSS